MLSPYDPANQPEAEQVKLSALILDERLQPRAGVDPDTVAEYEDAMRRGVEFEALWAIEVEDRDHGIHLVDGWQRRDAAGRLGLGEFPVRVWTGTWDEAVEFAAQCNARHGHPRTRADLAKTIAMLRALPQWRERSNVEIAKHVGVSEMTIRRAQAATAGGEADADSRFYLRQGVEDADKPLIQNEATPEEAVNRSEPEPKRITVKRGDQEYSMTRPRPAERKVEAETQSEPEAKPRVESVKNAGPVMLEMRMLARELSGAQLATLIAEWTFARAEVSLALGSKPDFLQAIGGVTAAWSSIVAWVKDKHRRDSERETLVDESLRAFVNKAERQQLIERLAGSVGVRMTADPVIDNEPFAAFLHRIGGMGQNGLMSVISFAWSKLIPANRRNLKAQWGWQRNDDEVERPAEMQLDVDDGNPFVEREPNEAQ
jgi:transposase